LKGRAWGCDYATAVDIEVNPQLLRLGRRESDFALQALVEGRASKTERVRVVALRCVTRWIPMAVKCASDSGPGGSVEKEDAKIRRACGWRC